MMGNKENDWIAAKIFNYQMIITFDFLLHLFVFDFHFLRILEIFIIERTFNRSLSLNSPIDSYLKFTAFSVP